MAAFALGPSVARALAARAWLSQMPRALVQAGLGDTDGAFASLERARAVRDFAFPELRSDKRWAPLDADPRFAELLADSGLPGFAQPPALGTR